jgi:hypothetical protein
MNTLVVISKYNEYSDWINEIKHNVLVYDKSENPIKNSIQRPNIGREAETLLYYIINNYYNLPEITIFLQGDPRSNPISYTYQEVLNIINSNHKYELKNICTFDGICNLKQYWLKSCYVLNNILFDNNSIVKYSSGCQYIIPSNSITQRPIELYKLLYNKILQYGDKPLNDKKENLEDGIDAWTLELIWGSIFDTNMPLKDNYHLFL